MSLSGMSGLDEVKLADAIKEGSQRAILNAFLQFSANDHGDSLATVLAKELAVRISFQETKRATMAVFAEIRARKLVPESAELSLTPDVENLCCHIALVGEEKRARHLTTVDSWAAPTSSAYVEMKIREVMRNLT